MPIKKPVRSPQKLWENLSSTLVHGVENIFFNLGVCVAKHPWRTIVITWLFVLLSGIGLLKFHIEKNPMKLWVPPDSDFYYDTNWFIENFGTGFRLQKVLITSNNVLNPNVLLKIHNITNDINSLHINYKGENYTMKELCFKVPVVNFFSSDQNSNKKVKVNTTITKNMKDAEYYDPTLWAENEFYCSFVESFAEACLQYNLLDLWHNDYDIIQNLTKHDIVSKVNNVNTNPITGHPMNFTELLGGVSKDETGDIIAANSLLLTWYTQVNMSSVDLDEVGNLVGTEEWVTVPLSMWETEFLALMERHNSQANNLRIYYEAGKSFGDISGQAMFNDLDKLFIGIFFMFVYIQLALSRFNWLEIRLTLGGVGLLAVGMAYITAVSWCSMFNIFFGPVHSSLPFLLMGLGIDDMFVMKACWDHLSDSEKKKSLPIKIGLMLKHAGVSIVITSFTDIVALLIGAITILPSLKSFCIYAAMGVFFIFCFSVTFYVAVFTLDVRRILSNRNGILFCYRHKKEIKISEKESLFQKLFAMFYKNIVFTIPVKIFVILFTIAMTGYSVLSIMQLEQRFDPKWFIPEGNYYKNFMNVHEQFYPDEGSQAFVFLGKMNYQEEFVHLYDLVQTMKNETYVSDVVNWVESFHGYVRKNFHKDLLNSTSVSDEKFRSYLSRFLFSPIGGRFQMFLKFDEPFYCGHTATNITASYMNFKFARFDGPAEYLPAMNNMKSIVKSTNITTGDGYRSVWAKVFANWVTDEIIGVEVERNIELALLCVILCTVVLITNLQMCLWIFLCVLLTIVNVLGWMQIWGMTVDIVCCIGLELAIGLCVDYAAHVGHTFLTITEGSRSERSLKTVTSIGTAVLTGGGSTLLSLSLLSTSNAYSFQSFFKIFLLVIVFGLFNGLIFLPVALSIIGPDGHKKLKSKRVEAETEELNGKELIAVNKS